jgi:hypothetical protein
VTPETETRLTQALIEQQFHLNAATERTNYALALLAGKDAAPPGSKQIEARELPRYTAGFDRPTRVWHEGAWTDPLTATEYLPVTGSLMAFFSDETPIEFDIDQSVWVEDGSFF